MSSHKIASTIRNQVFSRQYICNDRLPSERQLAEQFHVARGTVREALLQLEGEGIVKTRAGSGTYVTHTESNNPLPIIQSTSPLELIDARFALEPQIAQLAVLNATTHDIDRLHRTLEGFSPIGDDFQHFAQIDEDFHTALAECSHNSLIIWLHRHIIEIRKHQQWQKMKRLTLTQEYIVMYHQQHAKIVVAIEQRDAEEAVNLMRQHLQSVRSVLTLVASS